MRVLTSSSHRLKILVARCPEISSALQLVRTAVGRPYEPLNRNIDLRSLSLWRNLGVKLLRRNDENDTRRGRDDVADRRHAGANLIEVSHVGLDADGVKSIPIL